MIRRSLALALFGVVGAVACGGGTATIDNNAPTGGGQLQKQQDGSATGNGSTCSWSGTALLEGTVHKDSPPTYQIGASFPSLDGCNTCTCTAQGISCTEKSCGGGSSSSSSSSSSGGVACQADALVCPDGTTLGRTGPNCTFPSCPTDVKDAGVACGDVAKQCPDGTFVGATGPKCEFICPPVTCDQLATKARNEVDAILTANQACNTPDDCTNVAYATDCFSSCTRVISKAGVDKYNAAVSNANTNECKAFKSQGCTFPLPPCAAPFPPKCSSHTCGN